MFAAHANIKSIGPASMNAANRFRGVQIGCMC